MVSWVGDYLLDVDHRKVKVKKGRVPWLAALEGDRDGNHMRPTT